MTLNLRHKIVIQTRSSSETVLIGKTIGSRLLPGAVVALLGDLGAGKTQFIKGLAAGVGIGKSTYISSPSYTLINEYPGRIPFYHMDLFRLENVEEAELLGLEDYFQGSGVTAIEWADRIPSLLPEEMLFVSMDYVDERRRLIEITGKGKRYEDLVNRLSECPIGNSECGIS